MQKKKRIGAAALTVAMLLSGCGNKVEEQMTDSQQQSQSIVDTENNSVDFELEYEAQDYKDRFKQFQFKIPALTYEDKYATSYYAERDDEADGIDNHVMLIISHYNEKQDEGLYDLSKMDTAGNTLDVLFDGKIMDPLCRIQGYKNEGKEYTTEECEVNGLEAVRFEGTADMNWTDADRRAGLVGYCILGEKTPVLYCAVDLSEAQTQMEELAGYVDGMAKTFVENN